MQKKRISKGTSYIGPIQHCCKAPNWMHQDMQKNLQNVVFIKQYKRRLCWGHTYIKPSKTRTATAASFLNTGGPRPLKMFFCFGETILIDVKALTKKSEYFPPALTPRTQVHRTEEDNVYAEGMTLWDYGRLLGGYCSYSLFCFRAWHQRRST